MEEKEKAYFLLKENNNKWSQYSKPEVYNIIIYVWSEAIEYLKTKIPLSADSAQFSQRLNRYVKDIRDVFIEYSKELNINIWSRKEIKDISISFSKRVREGSRTRELVFRLNIQEISVENLMWFLRRVTIDIVHEWFILNTIFSEQKRQYIHLIPMHDAFYDIMDSFLDLCEYHILGHYVPDKEWISTSLTCLATVEY